MPNYLTVILINSSFIHIHLTSLILCHFPFFMIIILAVTVNIIIIIIKIVIIIKIMIIIIVQKCFSFIISYLVLQLIVSQYLD